MWSIFDRSSMRFIPVESFCLRQASMGKGVLRSFGAFIGVRPATSRSYRNDVDLSIKSSQVAGRQGRSVPVWRPMLHGGVSNTGGPAKTDERAANFAHRIIGRRERQYASPCT